MRKNAVLSAVLVFALCSALPAVADLRVATASTYPPYEFLNEKGMLDGFDHDLMEEIGRRIGEKIQWVDTGHYDMVIPTLVTNRADVIAAGMSATPIRARRVLFSTPYVPTMACFVTAPSFTVRKLEDLKGLRGAVPVGTTQDVFLTPRAAQYGYTIKTFAKIEECMWDIVTGRSDFTLMDVPVAEKLLANPNFRDKTVRGLTFQLTGAGKALAVRLGDTALKQKLDGAIAAMEQDGTLDAMRGKWGLGRK
ncbi:MAG: transporter substrate-binding domain-containing protein [Pyramidobacter sp.]|jgi:ABC-type amino acid transport substrate-binding protein